MAEIKSIVASDLDRDETAVLMGWCDCQTEDLWSGMKLQDILNVYHVSHEWMTFEGWSQEEGDIARMAWNTVVTDPKHHLELHDDLPEPPDAEGDEGDPLYGQRMDSADLAQNEPGQ